MTRQNHAQWVIVPDEYGIPYWERRLGGVVASVKRVILNGEKVWRYDVGFETWISTGYRDTVRSAKVAATKKMYWYTLREHDFRRSQSNLPLLWKAKGIGEVQPVRGHAWDESADTVVVDGILWRWQSDNQVWSSGAWSLWNDKGWTLMHPDGYKQTIHLDHRHSVMVEAAYWINLYLGR